MIRCYKIQNTDLWYKIFRHPADDDTVKEYFDVKWEWNKNATWAKIFFHRDDAASALVVIKTKGWKKTKNEKQSWSEL